MNYEQLVDFLQNRMKMSHVYQPVMLMTLLQQGGRCSTTEIARSILAHDQSQVEYYEDVTKNMVGRVLRNHGIVEKEGPLSASNVRLICAKCDKPTTVTRQASDEGKRARVCKNCNETLG